MRACKIKSYLLEQSRVCTPAPTERNYHVFYYILAGADAAERKTLGLLVTTRGGVVVVAVVVVAVVVVVVVAVVVVAVVVVAVVVVVVVAVVVVAVVVVAVVVVAVVEVAVVEVAVIVVAVVVAAVVVALLVPAGVIAAAAACCVQGLAAVWRRGVCARAPRQSCGLLGRGKGWAAATGCVGA
eukprot:3122530-Prymnesium_polylepis.1